MRTSLGDDESISNYVLTASRAATTLFENGLYGHFLVVLYSTIDTSGLLHAPAATTSASSTTFKAWAETFFIPHIRENVTATDLWAARCAVLHTYGTVSDLSRSGRARQIQYYHGDPNKQELADFVEITNRLDDGRHIAVHLGDFGAAFGKALIDFVPVLMNRCASCQATAKRLRDVMQVYPA